MFRTVLPFSVDENSRQFNRLLAHKKNRDLKT